MRLASYLALGVCVGFGGYLLADETPAAKSAPRPVAARSAKLPAIVVPPALDPVVDDVDVDLDLEEPVVEDELEEIRGHAPITDPAEFAMVFEVGGTLYLRLSQEERASERGEEQMVVDGGVYAVVAPVTRAALPAAYRAWSGKSVLVDGLCRARVVGFAEISRVAGEAGNMYEYDDEGNEHVRDEPPEWTIESVVDEEVTLAAKLDGACSGTWARSEAYSPAAIAMQITNPALEEAALADLLAKREDGDVDTRQTEWVESGGDGDWRDHAEVTSHVWQHPLTNEQWIFVQARQGGGGCGAPSFEVMAAYRAREDGTVRRAADLDYGYEDIHEIVDLDGDGQPELILGGEGETDASLVDLANTRHDSIHVAYHSYGCGC